MGMRNNVFARISVATVVFVMMISATGCGGANSADNVSDNKQQAPEPTGPITVVASINQWGSLAAELGGDDVSVTSIINATNVDAHDFEPTTADMAKLSSAQIVVSNGAGYDSWATRSISSTATTVSAASIVGAMDGDNPHLWFSKDARSGMAEELTDALSKALPSKKDEFKRRLKHWQAGERQIEELTKGFVDTDHNTDYAATEPVAYYLMADLGFKDITPKGYAQTAASGGEVAPADLQEFQSLIEQHDVALLLNNTQEASDTTNMLTGAAGRSDVPVIDVSEQMPETMSTLNEWIATLTNTIIDAVDPSYGCEADDDTDATHPQTDDEDASSDTDGGTGTSASTESDTAQGSTASADQDGDESPHFGRVCGKDDTDSK